MTNREFYYWIVGFAQLADDVSLDEHQIKIIKNHADLAQLTDGYVAKNVCRFIKEIEVCQQGQHQAVITRFIDCSF
ncbi:hypothetical protein [Piscirickettsia salmonis]|uniref:hypothetical protein n=1 Tax=Piscirickettsia salmonis TaxID=1238 RepID=UPI00031C0F24|nr:hypothetical protein [Piscirickettsia salmonis]APS56707.1 hypothetical protein AVI52_05255 [Piscirickettsia salmonis]ERL60421.1 hypothetical protein K661_03256 [Piscirickettsia salmonis LF-89 = ATCC VR-1361]PEQ16629.1 hypothetical protein X973_06415 [Piscirickettsia salmonis]QGN78061.1 hypothetical protein Psal001_02281 [Piscirickettsia salmonis]QGN81643.1 hypothetical protein Psal002_02298 [Piscirickettsia salmonis]